MDARVVSKALDPSIDAQLARLRGDVEAAQLLLDRVLSVIGTISAKPNQDATDQSIPVVKIGRPKGSRGGAESKKSLERKEWQARLAERNALLEHDPEPIPAEVILQPDKAVQWKGRQMTAEYWPAGCHNPANCTRNRACSYMPCPRQGTDITGLIDAATRCAAPDATAQAAPEQKPFSMLSGTIAPRSAP